MAKATIAKVNASIKALGGNEILVKGDGYFYFAEGKAIDWPSVYVYRISDLTLDRWLEEYTSRRNEAN
jgi:hypothetical protein